MSFIINVFENLLKYNEKEVFIVLDINNDIWFKMKDILKLLNYSSIKKAIYKLNIDKKFKIKYKYIKGYPLRDTPLNAQPNAIFINESGLYQVLSNSTKLIASRFRDELFTNILPTIRKTGIYKLKASDNKKLKIFNKKLKEEIDYYEDKHKYKPTNNSYIYILKKNIGSKKCYKIGYTNNIEKRIAIYKTGKTNINLVYYIAINFDGKQTEDCIKNTNKLHKLKKKTDDLCYLSINQLKISIQDCINKFINHFCICTYCKKKFKFNKIDKHNLCITN
jgi:prophage antirepressor-like protein